MKFKNGIILLLVGLFFLGISFVMNKLDENRMQNLDASTFSIQTDYKVRRDSDSTMYTPQYTYVVKGKKYVCTSNFSSSIKPSNEPRKIFYNSQNPHDCFPQKGQQEKIFLFIFTLIPIIAIVAGVASMLGLLPEPTQPLTHDEFVQEYRQKKKRRKRIDE